MLLALQAVVSVVLIIQLIQVTIDLWKDEAHALYRKGHEQCLKQYKSLI